MRYSIMLQLVGIITFILMVTAVLFAWIQSRPNIPEKTLQSNFLRNE